MLLLMAVLEKPTDNESLRIYQRERWGRLSDGETCVIELCGLSANSLKVPRDRELFRAERVQAIRQRMLTYTPELVVMYGQNQKHWEEIAGSSFPPDGVIRLQSTVLAFTPHPTSYGLVSES